MRRAALAVAWAGAALALAGTALADEGAAASDAAASDAAATSGGATNGERAGKDGAQGAKGAPLEVRVLGDQSARDAVPGSSTTITAREMDRAVPLDAAELLRRVPGLTVREDEGAGLRFDLGVRGLDGTRGRRVLVLEDGVPLAANPYAEPDVLLAPTIARAYAIEVAKGSGSIAFGPQTVGGVVDFLTLPPPSERRVRLELLGGAPAFGRVLARYGDAAGRVRTLVQVMHEQGAGFRADPYRIDDVLAKAAVDTSPRGALVLKLGLHDEEAVSTEVGLTSAMLARDPRRPVVAPDDRAHGRRLEASIVHEHRFTPELSLRTLAYAYTVSRVWRRQTYDRVALPGVAYARIAGDASVPGGAIFFRNGTSTPDRTYDVAALEPRLAWRVATGPAAHAVQVGARILVERARRAEREGTSPGSYDGTLALDEHHSSTAVAAFVEDRIALPFTLAITPGVRVEHVAYERAITRAAASPSAGDSTAGGVIPGVGLTVGPADAQAFGGVHVGFAPPRVATAIGASGANAQLDAERSLAWEAGARLSLRRALHVDVAGFLETFENQIVPGPDAVLVNGGATRHEGVEAEASFALGRAAQLGFDLDLGARYTLSRATFVGGTHDGNVVPYAPLHSASATLDVDHPCGLGGELAWSYVGAQFADDENTIAPDPSGRVGRIDAHHVIDVAARYRIARTGLTLLFTVKNLFDTIYVASRRPDGIFLGGFRQIAAGIRYDGP